MRVRPPVEEEEEHDERDAQGDDQGDLREKRHQHIAQALAEESRVEDPDESGGRIAVEERPGVVRGAGRHHRDLHPALRSGRDAQQAGEAVRYPGRRGRRGGQRI